MPAHRTPALVAGAAGFLLIGVALGFRAARSGGSAEPAVKVDAPSDPVAPAPAPARAEDATPAVVCDGSTVAPASTMYGALRLSVKNDGDPFGCGLEVTSADGEQLLTADEGWMQIAAQYVDLDRDAVPELLVSAASGGSANFHDSWIFSQAPRARLAEKIPTLCEVRILDAGQERDRTIETCDLGYYASGEYCDACAPRPAMYYKYIGGRLENVNTQFVPRHDESIAAKAKYLVAQELEGFVASRDAEDPAYADSTVKFVVLGMAADYVASGRPEEARRTLEQMWPAWDLASIIEQIAPAPPPG